MAPALNGNSPTMFHELAHATGHEKRLHRREVMDTEELGPTDIGREELVAEFTASYLCAEAGIAPATIENQAAYIENWTRVLKNDRRALVVAAGAAQRVADDILDRQPTGTATQRAIERQREHKTDVQRGDEEPAATASLEPATDRDEPSLPTAIGREPEEIR